MFAGMGRSQYVMRMVYYSMVLEWIDFCVMGQFIVHNVLWEW